MSRFILALIFILSTGVLITAQKRQVDAYLQGTDGADFFQVQTAMNTFYVDNPSQPGFKQWKRKEWFLEPRLYPDGKTFNIAKHTINEHRRYQRTQAADRSTHGGWWFLGPNNWSPGNNSSPGLGRLNCIELDPNNGDIIYVGASNGGVWKTTNGGTTWANITPNLPMLAVADIEIDPNNSDKIFVLTGDGDPVPNENGSHAQTEVSSIGILRSTNGGATWYATNFAFDHPTGIVPSKLLMHPTDEDIQFVAANDGIYKTEDEWATWTLVFPFLTYDIEFHPSDADIMYASGNSWIRRSVDMGDSWDPVSDDNFVVLNNASRVEIAVSPETENGVYAIAGNWNRLVGVFRSLSSGTNNSWTLRDSSASTHGRFADYCIGFVADPDDFTDLYGGMQNMSRSTSGGSTGTWSDITQNVVHADVHDVVMTSDDLYVACDGGLYHSTDNGNSWTDLTIGMSITEVYRIAGTPQNTNLHFCGTQDNGTFRRNASTNFDASAGSDGMECIIKYTDSDIVYSSAQRGGFRKSTNGGDSWSGLNVPGDASAWISPMIMDPVDPEVLFFGRDSLYRSDDEGATFQFLGMPTGADLNCLAQGTSNRNRLYVSSNSEIFRSDDALVDGQQASWTDIGAGLPNRFITGIAVDPDNSFRVFVTLSGFSDGEKVFMSTVGGNNSNWVNISGSLPNIAANCIVYQDTEPNIDALYIGMDDGVYYRDNDLGDWVYFSTGMPAVNVNDLYLNTTSNTLVAGTYGRGMWESDLYSTCDENVIVSNPPGIPLGGVSYVSANNSIRSTAQYRRDLGTRAHYTAGGHVLLNPGFNVGGRAVFEAVISGCPGVTAHPLISAMFPTGVMISSEIQESEIRVQD